MNEEDEAKGALQTHSPRKVFQVPLLITSHTRIPTPQTSELRLSHTIFPSPMPFLISVCCNPIHPSRFSRNVIASNFPMHNHLFCLLTHLPISSSLTILYYSLCVCVCTSTLGVKIKEVSRCKIVFHLPLYIS